MADPTVTVTGWDGTRLQVEVTFAATPPPPPPPPPAPLACRVGAAVYPVAGVDILRSPDALVVYRPAPGVNRTRTNEWGIEAAVIDGRVTTVRDRQPSRLQVGTDIPPNGYVLSGHGAARDWMQLHVTVGATVVLDGTPAPDPTPGPTPPPSARGRTIAVYMMDGIGRISQIPAQCNQVRVAFLQGRGLVEWGGDSPSKTAADLTAWRSAGPGRTVLVSIGGQDGIIDFSALEQSVRAIEKTFPLDGIDWDVEVSELDVATCVGISRRLAAGREATWVTSFAPSGGPPVGQYLKAAVQCQQAGLRVQFGSQLYDTEVSLSDAAGVLGQEIDALGQESVLVGMMIRNDAKHWTNAQCKANMKAIADKWPNIGGAYLWESASAGTAQWAADMDQVIPR